MTNQNLKEKTKKSPTSDFRFPTSVIGHPTSDHRGITLIALIITIIVMLILVAVTVSIVVNSGLFGHASNASKGWNEAQEAEQKLGNGEVEFTVGNKTYNSIDDYLAENPSGSTSPDRSYLKVGDYVNYTPDTADTAYSLTTAVSGYTSEQSIPQDTTLKWQIMNINSEDGTVDLIAAAPISKAVYFRNATGYNNGVYVLNNLCNEHYSNTSLGATARSIDLEDIEPKFNSTGLAARDAYTFEGIQYGETKTYSGDKSYAPDIYDHVEKTTAGESVDYYTADTMLDEASSNNKKETLEVKQKFYKFENTLDSYMDDKEFHKLIFGTDTSYWLASRYAQCGSGNAYFGLRYVNSATLFGDDLFYSDGYPGSGGFRVRPVVTLRSNVKISETGGTADSPRELSL